MPSLVAISQATTEINRGAESAPPGIECFKSPRSHRAKGPRNTTSKASKYESLRLFDSSLSRKVFLEPTYAMA